jgi:DNA-directed RNA polymerase specialized sigma24 family protein
MDGEELVARARRGDAVAFEDLYRALGPIVGRWLRRQAAGWSEQDLEDLEADVWLRLWRVRDRHRPGRSSYLTWACAVARRELIDHWRRRRRAGPGLPLPAGWDPPQPPEELGPRSGVRRWPVPPGALAAAIARLPAAEREALELRYRAGLRLREVAARQGVGIATAHRRLGRALRGLRASLGVAA